MLLSGGVDSAAALWLMKKSYDVYGLSFRYGERNRNEMRAAKQLAGAAGVTDHTITDVGFLRDIAEITAAEGGKGKRKVEQGVSSCYVPGRNTIFLGIAAHFAEIKGATRIVTGHNFEDSFPDAKPGYFRAINRTIAIGSGGVTANEAIKVVAPFLWMSKAQVLRKAIKLNVPLELTWSCYEDGGTPCGTCHGCVSLKRAVEEIKAEKGGRGSNALQSSV